MRISDWSSDVCSSDLFLIVRPVARLEHVEIEPCLAVEGPRRIGATERMEGHQVARIGRLDRAPQHLPRLGILIAERLDPVEPDDVRLVPVALGAGAAGDQIGSASCRDSVCQCAYASVVAVSFKYNITSSTLYRTDNSNKTHTS